MSDDCNTTAKPKVTSSLSATEREQLGTLFSQIATAAIVLGDLFHQMSEDFNNSAIFAALPVISKMGYCADLGAEVLGELLVKGGAKEWFMPPKYHLETPEGESTHEQ